MVLSQQREYERSWASWQYVQSGKGDGTEESKEKRWDEESWKKDGRQEGLLVAVSIQDPVTAVHVWDTVYGQRISGNPTGARQSADYTAS